MAEGNSNLRSIVLLFCMGSALSIILRLCLQQLCHGAKLSPVLEPSPSHEFTDLEEGKEILPPAKRSLIIPIIVILLVVTFFLPPYPWRHLTATLPYDVAVAMSTVLMSRAFHGSLNRESFSSNSTNLGDHPLGQTTYNPADDPYYITNLDDPISEFFISALKDTKFTNVVQIVLESMREDSFPYDEEGLLHQHIVNNLTPVEGGTPVNTETITPFIASLANNTISWHTMWSTIPYTHKAMLGCTRSLYSKLTPDWCGIIPAPLDWTVELVAPSAPYQHCLPQVFRYLSSVTNTEEELMDIFRNNSRPRTTDQWETVHIHSSTGEWDLGRDVIKSMGFNSVILAEQLAELNGRKQFPSTFGYFDDGYPASDVI
jgi:hypothetical protein